MIVAGCFALITYLVGNHVFADYLQLHYVPGSGELAVFCSALVGASLGFLWFNAPPAQVFMGDTGSLACGGALGVISVITRHEFVLAIIGGLFVIEALSVIIQVISFKTTGRRVFKMAPIHHHFEKLGWKEPTIVIRFWIIAWHFRPARTGYIETEMITVKAYANQKIGVFGLGKAGEATIASLLAGGAQIFASDDSAESCKRASGKFAGNVEFLPVEQWPWEQIKALVLSPGVPLTHPKPHASVELAKKYGCPVIGDIELLYLSCPHARYVGITGTNGKSTTTTLIGHILKEAGLVVEVGGNLGTAALSLNALDKGGIYVLELSSYQLDLLHTARFNVAAFLNVTPDHLDRHGSMEGYVAAKKHIFERQKADDTAVVAVDDAYTKAVAAELKKGKQQRVVEVSQAPLGEGIFVDKGVLHDGALRFDLGGIVDAYGQA